MSERYCDECLKPIDPRLHFCDACREYLAKGVAEYRAYLRSLTGAGPGLGYSDGQYWRTRERMLAEDAAELAAKEA